MATIPVTLPDNIQRDLAARVGSEATPDLARYIRDLIAADLAAGEQWDMTPDIAKLLDEGASSGESTRSLADIIAEGRARWTA